MPATASEVMAEARKHLKKTESPANSNKTEFGKWYGVNGVAWCAIFVSYVLYHAGASDILKGAQSAKGAAVVSKIKAHLKKTGAKQIKPADAKGGDIVIFDFPGGYETDHVGFIRAYSNVAKKQIYTLEGNTSSNNGGSQANGGGVYERTRSFGVVESIWRPNYLPAEPKTEAAAPKAEATGLDVKKLQERLGVTVDGIYGDQTTEAVKAFQAKKGIVVTGIADAETLARLYK